jgi:hypothetical protein
MYTPREETKANKFDSVLNVLPSDFFLRPPKIVSKNKNLSFVQHEVKMKSAFDRLALDDDD